MEPSSIGLNVAPELGLHGDVAAVLDQLTEAWDAKPKDAWLQTAKQGGEQMHQTWADLGKVEGSPVPPGRVPAAIVERTHHWIGHQVGRGHLLYPESTWDV